jgi:membrane protein
VIFPRHVGCRAPGLVREELKPAIHQVLEQRSQALVAVGVFATVWTAASGMQAVRTALNRAYGIARGLLPDADLRSRSIMPGAATGALLWVTAAILLSFTLRSAGKLVLIYGYLAGIVATMVFLYVSAATLIFGAEVNAAMDKRADNDGS